MWLDIFLCVFFCKPYGFLCKQYARFNAVIYPIIKFWQFIFLYIQISNPLLYTWHANVFSLIFPIPSLFSCKKHRFLKFGCSPICYWLSFCRNSVKSLCNSKLLDVTQCPSSWLQQQFDFHNFAMALTVLEPEHGVPSILVKPSPPELPPQPNMEKLLKQRFTGKARNNVDTPQPSSQREDQANRSPTTDFYIV